MSKRLTSEEFIERAIKVHGGRYDYSLVDYIGSKDRVIIICKDHGEFEQIPNDHLSGHGCNLCGENRKILQLESFINRSRSVHGDRYDYSETKYINFRTKLRIRCKIHGFFYQYPSNHMAGNNCPKCNEEDRKRRGKSRRLTNEDFIKDCTKVHNGIYDYSETIYMDSRSKVIVKCPKHGRFYPIANLHKRGSGCPHCNKSKGELLISNILNELGIKYITQKTFEDLKSERNYPYKFDFFIPKKETVIEYDGELHFRPYEHFGGEERLHEYVENDKKKDDYCKLNGIKLIRIPYTLKDNEIKSILEEALCQSD